MIVHLKKTTVNGILVGLALWTTVLFLANKLQLSDRERYLRGGWGDHSTLDLSRTSIVDSIFGLNPLVEPILVLISTLLLIKLSQKLFSFYNLYPKEKLILYAFAFTPFRLLFRSYASKELLFALFCELFIVTLLNSEVLFSPLHKRFSIFHPSVFLYWSTLISSFLFCMLLRPFYGILLFIPFFLAFPFKNLSTFSARKLLLFCTISGITFLCFLLFSPYFDVLTQFMKNYFLIDGANSNSTRLAYQAPDLASDFIFKFFSAIAQPLIGPYISEVSERPILIFLFLEGIFCVYFFFLILKAMLSIKHAKILSANLLLILSLSLTYILFVFYIFSIINFMGGIRFQSSSVPILMYIYAYSTGFSRPSSTPTFS